MAGQRLLVVAGCCGCGGQSPPAPRGSAQKHFHTDAQTGRRCESAFALLSHQKVTKRLFLAEIYDKIEDGRISGKGAILWELRFRV